MRNTAAIQVGDQITYSTGRHTITLARLREDVWSVVTYQGTLRLDEMCGSWTTEDTARAHARGLAQLFRAEDTRCRCNWSWLTGPCRVHAVDRAEDAPSLTDTVPAGEKRQIAPTMACAHLAATTDPQEAALAVAVLTGRVERGGNPGQATRPVLAALARKGLLTLTAKPGPRKADWAYGEPTAAGFRRYARLSAVAA